MPYIREREWLDRNLAPLITAMTDDPNVSAGEVNYAITRIVAAWHPDGVKNMSYEALNAKLGVLEAVKLELYRRVVAPYEDTKCKENGDVY